MGTKKYFYPSTEKDSCGLDCLRMLLSDYSGDKNFIYYSINKKAPYSLLDLVEAGHKYGLKLEGYRALDKQELRNNDSFPLMLVVTVDERLHMVILDKIKGEKAYIRDPATGRKKMALSKLIDLWTGEYLLVSNANVHSYHGGVPEKLDNKGRLINCCFTLFSQASIWLSFYLISTTNDLLLPLLSFAGFIIFEIASRLYSVHLLKNFDDLYLSRLSTKDDILENYASYQHFKSLYFALPLGMVMSLLGFLALSVLFIYNDFNFLYATLALVFYGIFDAFLLEPYVKKRSLKLEQKEGQLKLLEKGEERNRLIYHLSLEGHEISTIMLFKKLVGTFYLGVVALLLSIGLGATSLNHFMISFSGLYAMNLSLMPVLNGLANLKKIKASKIDFRRRFLFL